jgi:hypothetical protein
MQGGRIVMQGAKADLEARGGLYAELMASGVRYLRRVR